MKNEKLYKILAKNSANVAHDALMLTRENEWLDGDETEAFSKLFLQELDYLNGNENEIDKVGIADCDEKEDNIEEEPNCCPKCGKIIPDNYYLCQSCEAKRR